VSLLPGVSLAFGFLYPWLPSNVAPRLATIRKPCNEHRSLPHLNPKPLLLTAHLLNNHILHLLLSPTQANFIQSANRPLQRHFDDNLHVSHSVRNAAKHAGVLVDAKPDRTLSEYKPGLFDVSKTCRLNPDYLYSG
jgi:hypothetical protein